MNQQNNQQRQGKIIIDGMLYKVLVEEAENAKETPYDAIRRLIQNHQGRICCLDTNGGKKVC